jgi:hypothetical protein
VTIYGGLGRLSAAEYEAIERRIAEQGRAITPRLGPKRRPAPKKGWDSSTVADIAFVTVVATYVAIVMTGAT